MYTSPSLKIYSIFKYSVAPVFHKINFPPLPFNVINSLDIKTIMMRGIKSCNNKYLLFI
jgi:hypothetical protein